MARYRQKDELDLAWNKIRRQITRDLDTEIMNFREELLDDLLTTAFDKYVAELEGGKKPELSKDANQWIKTLLGEVLTPALEGVRTSVAPSDVEG